MGFIEEIEKEAKYLISEQDYQKLMQFIDGSNTVIQTNYYFDFDDYKLGLNKDQGTTVRIREKNGTYELTVKTHDSVSGNNFSSTEHNQIITKEEFEVYHKFGIPCELLPMLEYSDKTLKLQNIGCMTTDRCKIYITNEEFLYLDKNRYLDIVDYEIEFEYHKEHQLQLFMNFIKDREIQVVSSNSKLRRFLSKLK